MKTYTTVTYITQTFQSSNPHKDLFLVQIEIKTKDTNGRIFDLINQTRLDVLQAFGIGNVESYIEENNF